MSERKLNTVGFAPVEKGGFHQAVIAGVNDYFRKNNISPYANSAMWVKTAIMLSVYFVPYFLIIGGIGKGSPWLFFSLWFLMAWGMVGIGTSVMHDANHGTYSPKQRVNDLISSILEIIGGYRVTWRIQHNILHHTYTNIAGLDEDLHSTKLLRFSPQNKRYAFHRYQHLYIWFFYMLMTLFWMTFKDYVKVNAYSKHDLLKKYNVTFRHAVLRITLYKLFYYSYIMVLPIVFSGMAWYYVVLGFLLMHLTSGLFLACIFQPAHILETSAFHLPVEKQGKQQMEESWAIHEVANTCDFAPNNRPLTWFIGGLNFQIEHHLFTRICHVHYPRLAPIVHSIADDFGVPYHIQPTFRQALLAHVRMLKKLGRE